jgi:hypothetical protein
MQWTLFYSAEMLYAIRKPDGAPFSLSKGPGKKEGWEQNWFPTGTRTRRSNYYWHCFQRNHVWRNPLRNFRQTPERPAINPEPITLMLIRDYICIGLRVRIKLPFFGPCEHPSRIAAGRRQ